MSLHSVVLTADMHLGFSNCTVLLEHTIPRLAQLAQAAVKRTIASAVTASYCISAIAALRHHKDDVVKLCATGDSSFRVDARLSQIMAHSSSLPADSHSVPTNGAKVSVFEYACCNAMQCTKVSSGTMDRVSADRPASASLQVGVSSRTINATYST